MNARPGSEAPPGRVRLIVATLVVVLMILAAWAVIEYRSQPPPPPHPVHGRSAPP
ncbi:MAG: hypothetical protein M3Y86_05165 [Verrucomicrobiota bacterium]|nr:hypothetical protein [Verrucomicrobiota bacterium]